MANTQKTIALVLGIVLLIFSIWGLILPGGIGQVFWVFGVNYALSILYLIAAVFGIYVGIRGKGPTYNVSIGWIGVILGIIGFIPYLGTGTNNILSQLLNINTEATIFHLVIGLVALGVYYGVKE